jgi:uncharacterized membrane protein
MSPRPEGFLRSILWSLVTAGVMAGAGIGVLGLACLLGYLLGSALLPGFTAILLGTGLILAGLIQGERGRIPGLEVDGFAYGFIITMLTAIIGFVVGELLVEHRRVSWGEQREVTIADAASHSEATILRLRDGQLNARKVFTLTHHHPARNSVWYEHGVVPVLPAGWRPGEPVRVWAVCKDFDDDSKEACLEAWRASSNWGVVIAPEEQPCYQRTVPTKYAPPDGRVVFVRWTESPEAYERALEAEAFSVLRACAIAWCVLSGLYLLFTVRASWRRA